MCKPPSWRPRPSQRLDACFSERKASVAANRPSHYRLYCLYGAEETTLRLSVPPTIRLQFLQRLALDARNNSAHQPARLAHLDDHYQGRDRIKRGQASAEIIDLGHGAISISSCGR